MITKRHPAATTTGATGIKALITIASLAGVLAGWAFLSSPPPAATSSEASGGATAYTAPPPAWLLSEPQIPTLPPVVTIQSLPTAAISPPVASNGAAAVSPATSAGLSGVSATQPAPITMTRSSR
ncbi:MAG: hypothetical protein RMK84_01430 [Oscillochloridaceae bacterium]|nr:hypothetical protein [Chloroflexaceae bacterium]MDW8388761.1 hypothetical protein [Oscillochloridaceae bacterium]